MSNPKGGTPFWINLAANAAARISRLGKEMRDEWREGQAEVPPTDEKPAPETSQGTQRALIILTPWWEVLQVSRTASKEEIQQAWRRLIKQNHPDRAAHLSEAKQAELDKEAKRLNEAYEIAMNES